MNRPARPAKEEISAGGVVFRRTPRGVRFLLIRDSYRNWGFPKGHLEAGETADVAALREVREETGLRTLALQSAVQVIDWHFRFRGTLIHKVCHFYLIEAARGEPRPLRKEGITACRWVDFARATEMVTYDNARAVLAQAHALLDEALEASHPPESVA